MKLSIKYLGTIFAKTIFTVSPSKGDIIILAKTQYVVSHIEHDFENNETNVVVTQLR